MLHRDTNEYLHRDGLGRVEVVHNPRRTREWIRIVGTFGSERISDDFSAQQRLIFHDAILPDIADLKRNVAVPVERVRQDLCAAAATYA